LPLYRDIFKALASYSSRLALKTQSNGRHSKIYLLIVTAIVAFAYGTASNKFKFFPHYQIRPLFNFIEDSLGLQPEAVRVATRQEYRTEKSISTALLPLTIETYNVGLKVSLTHEAGGICQLGNSLLIADRMGLPFLFDLKSHEIIPLNWPNLPNNYSEFLNSGKAISKNNFRVHDLLCRATSDGFQIFLAHEFYDPSNGLTHLAVSSLTVASDMTTHNTTWSRIFTSTALPGSSYAANGAGGRLAIEGNDDLYLTIGDYNLDGILNPTIVAQDPKTDQGSIIKINLKTGARTRISIGHRNPQGLVIAKNGEILATEHGPKGGDELNRIVANKNYGWPVVTYGTDYNSYTWPPNPEQGRHDGYEKPIFAWVPSIGVSQLIEINSFNERWAGDLLVSSLKAGAVFRLRYDDGIIRYSEPIWIGPRIRDIVELTTKQIALWTDQAQIILISVDQTKLTDNKRAMAPVMEPGSTNCMACHHVGVTNENDAAPSLSGILNRKVASDNFANYSDALKNLGGNWTEDRLRAFLLDPNQYAPGTNMVIGDQTKSQVDKIIDYLKKLD
jgi:cytochrome c2